MYALKNITTDSYIMMYSFHNSINRVPETVNKKLAKRFSKKEATQILTTLNSKYEFKKYTLEKLS
jgi:hypothetical protein